MDRKTMPDVSETRPFIRMLSLKRVVRYSIAAFLITLGVCLVLYYKVIYYSNVNYTVFSKALRQIRPGANMPFLDNKHTTVMKSPTYSLWKRISLHPADKKGRAIHRRYGEPLELYTLSGHIESSEVTYSWSFEEGPNRMIDCPSLFSNFGYVSHEMQAKINSVLTGNFRDILKRANDSCDDFIRTSGYITSPLTKTEASFPVAFSILVYKDAEQVELLLRNIYRPQNVYCIHIDKKSPAAFRSSLETIVNCFSNVFITSKSVDVRWGEFSVLQPEIICLNALWEMTVKWKYFINLTGQELPLRTNHELVKILMAFDGANNVEAVSSGADRTRKAGRPPHDVVPAKGALHVVLSRAFVDFLLHNRTAIDLLQWSKKVKIPDEIYFSTLNFNKVLAAPGSYKGRPRTTKDKNPFIARLKNWSTESHCDGKFVRGICVFGTNDLPLLATREELFANKIHFDYHPEIMVCMKELLYNRTAEEYHGHLYFNASYYASRDFVKNRF